MYIKNLKSNYNLKYVFNDLKNTKKKKAYEIKARVLKTTKILNSIKSYFSLK